MLRLRQVRKQQKLSLKDLGVRTGLSLKLLSKYELGTVDPPSSKLLCISMALGVPIGMLYPENDTSGIPTNDQEPAHV
jgi:transcriptional regulator with XRE-family HTH domain